MHQIGASRDKVAASVGRLKLECGQSHIDRVGAAESHTLRQNRKFHGIGHRLVDNLLSEPQHHAGLAQLREILLQQSAPQLAALVCLECLLARRFVAIGFVPNALHRATVGIAIAAHKLHKISIVLSDALGVHQGGVDGLVNLAAKKFHQACRTLAAQAAVVVIASFGRCGTSHHHTMQLQLLAEKHRRNVLAVHLNKRVVGLNFSVVHLEAYATRYCIECGVADLHRPRHTILTHKDKRIIGHSNIDT